MNNNQDVRYHLLLENLERATLILATPYRLYIGHSQNRTTYDILDYNIIDRQGHQTLLDFAKPHALICGETLDQTNNNDYTTTIIAALRILTDYNQSAIWNRALKARMLDFGIYNGNTPVKRYIDFLLHIETEIDYQNIIISQMQQLLEELQSEIEAITTQVEDRLPPFRANVQQIDYDEGEGNKICDLWLASRICQHLQLVCCRSICDAQQQYESVERIGKRSVVRHARQYLQTHIK